jgi:hypothetical protein
MAAKRSAMGVDDVVERFHEENSSALRQHHESGMLYLNATSR